MQAEALRQQHLHATLGKYWSRPFRYCPEGQFIVDARDNRIIDVRSWGHLTGTGSHALPDGDAEAIIDEVGAMVARFLNGQT